jgi:chromosome segregation ATPase
MKGGTRDAYTGVTRRGRGGANSDHLIEERMRARRRARNLLQSLDMSTATETQQRLQRLTDDLRQQRDELRVKLHLLKADAQDEWKTLEEKWQHLQGRMKVVGNEAGDAAHEVGEALRLVGEELKRGYARIRKLL